jgi:hypothetical protein
MNQPFKSGRTEHACARYYKSLPVCCVLGVRSPAKVFWGYAYWIVARMSGVWFAFWRRAINHFANQVVGGAARMSAITILTLSVWPWQTVISLVFRSFFKKALAFSGDAAAERVSIPAQPGIVLLAEPEAKRGSAADRTRRSCNASGVGHCYRSILAPATVMFLTVTECVMGPFAKSARFHLATLPFMGAKVNTYG